MQMEKPVRDLWPQVRCLDDVKSLLQHVTMPSASAARLPVVWELLQDRPYDWQVSAGVPVPARAIASLYRRRLENVRHLQTTALGLLETLASLEELEGNVVLVHCRHEGITLLLVFDGADSTAGMILFREPHLYLGK
jgi:hypothetical protein